MRSRSGAQLDARCYYRRIMSIVTIALFAAIPPRAYGAAKLPEAPPAARIFQRTQFPLFRAHLPAAFMPA
jgi:hypothetical protein